ncbi:MAG: RDD family protein [Candidatus Enteromonas sp.]
MEKPINLEYFKAPMTKRTFAFFFDFICMAIVALGFFAAGRTIVENSGFYRDAFDTYVRISRDSALYTYEETEDYLVTVTDYAKVTYAEDPSQRVAYLENRFRTFYVADPVSCFENGEGAEIYASQKVGESAIKQGDGSLYFALNSEQNPEPIVDDATLCAFYDEAMTKALVYLSNNEAYVSATRTLNRTYNVAIIPISIALSFVVFEFLFPLVFFRRGYQTLGMRTFRLGLLTAEAVSPRFPRFLARFAWMLVVEVLASLVTFGIPLFFNIGMAFIRKDGQALHDYMTGVYMVDCADQSIYRSKEEYLLMQAKAEATQARPYLSTWKGDHLDPVPKKQEGSSIEDAGKNTYNQTEYDIEEPGQDGNSH